MGMCQGLLSLKRKKGPGPEPGPGPGPGPLRDMNVRTAATGHKSLSNSPNKSICFNSKGVSLGRLYPDTIDLWFLSAVH